MDVVCEDFEIEPHFPFEAPFPYQTKALEEWKSNGYKGLFNMATGTGKTITSLNCLLSLYKDTGYYKAIILVPTIPLVDQWEKECRKFYFEKIYKVSSRSDWKSNITRLTRAELLYPDRNSYIVISTYASFVRQATYERLSELSLDTLLIADEAHNMGSSSCLKLLVKIPYEKRIGLSATPERQFDEIGNLAICNFFGCSLNSYIVSYTILSRIDFMVS
jgi:superfamily II DNA or RNA helicase